MTTRPLFGNSAINRMLVFALIVIYLTLSGVASQFDASLFDDGFSKGSQASSMDQFGAQEENLYQSQTYDKSRKRMQYRQAANMKSSTTQKPGGNNKQSPTGQPQASRMADAQIAYNQLSQPNAALLGQQSVYMNDQGQLVGSEKTMEQFLDRLLHESVYDRRIRPLYTDSKTSKPVEVLMNMHINTISGISEVNMEYIVDCYFRQEWYDPRLMYSNSSWKHVEDITLHYDLVNKVWTPDAFFRNSKDAKSHMITVPNRLIRIFPEGRVLFSQRLTLRLECPMKLQKFPLDNQTCVINIGSFGYTLKDIKFDWSAVAQPVTINSKLEMPDFILTTHNSSVCKRITSTGPYACLEVHFYLKRSFGYYLVQVYIPSILTCLISFVSFWVDHRAVPARISVGLLTVLTITTQSSGIRSQLPKVSYIKAIDVWMSACLVFVFAALLEYAVVNVIARKQELKKLVKLSEKHKQERKLNLVNSNNKSSVMGPNTEKVMAIGNRLANLNAYKRSELEAMSGGSQEALENLLHQQPTGAVAMAAPSSASFRRKPYSQNSLHVDSAVSISAVSQQSIGVPPSPALTASQPPAPPVTPSAAAPPSTLPVGPIRDDAQMVDFVSSFLFPISFIIFNIIYWMVYLNMQVHSGN